MLELAEKGIKTVIITISYKFKKLNRQMEGIKKDLS